MTYEELAVNIGERVARGRLEIVDDGGRLVVRSRDRLPDEFRAALAQYKPLLVATYAGAGDAPATTAENARYAAGEGWTGEAAALVAWFLANEDSLPAEPFELTSYSRVVDPVVFYDGLRRAIAEGPGGYPARCGNLFAHLRQLHSVFATGCSFG